MINRVECVFSNSCKFRYSGGFTLLLCELGSRGRKGVKLALKGVKLWLSGRLKRERFKAEFVDEEGAKITVTLDGNQADRSLAKFVLMVERLRKAKVVGLIPKNPQGTAETLDGAWEPVEPIVRSTSKVRPPVRDELRSPDPTGIQLQERSKINDVLVLVRSLPDDWFTSLDLRAFYEQRFGNEISLSMISTYLSRLVDKGFLYRMKAGRSFRYRMRRDTVKTQVL